MSAEVSIDQSSAAFFKRVREAALLCRMINNRFRQQVIQLLDQQASCTVTEIFIKLRLEQSEASTHLAVLRRSGVVISKRQGKFIYYELNYERIAEVNQFLAAVN